MPRNDQRAPDQLRPVRITPNCNKYAEGSALIECGDTRVICTASVEDKLPPFLRGKGRGWVTSEYSMLPRSTNTRMPRESTRGKASGRTQEIQRLIGRSLRSVTDLVALKERSIWVDCDVVQADGGTRTASITGAFVALALALGKLVEAGDLERPPLVDYLAAVSAGIVDGRACLDLNYQEDKAAEVDMNVVMTGQDCFVELQGTAEGLPFSQAQLDRLVALARGGIHQLIEQQQSVLDQCLSGCDLFQTQVGVQVATPAGNQE